MAVEYVPSCFEVTLDDLCSSDKRRELVQARGILAKAAQIKKGLDLRMVCLILQNHHGTVSRLAATAKKDPKAEMLAACMIDKLD